MPHPCAVTMACGAAMAVKRCTAKELFHSSIISCCPLVFVRSAIVYVPLDFLWCLLVEYNMSPERHYLPMEHHALSMNPVQGLLSDTYDAPSETSAFLRICISVAPAEMREEV